MKQVISFMILMLVVTFSSAKPVIFKPEIRLPNIEQPCQGILKSVGDQVHVLTTPLCMVSISEKLRKAQSVRFTDEDSKFTGEVKMVVSSDPANSFLKAELNQPLENYFEAYDTGTTKLETSSTTAYYFYPSENGESLFNSPVTLGPIKKNNGSYFYSIENDEVFPPGTLVRFGNQNICMVLRDKGICQALSTTNSKQKRSLSTRQAPGCELRHIDCINFELVGNCVNGTGTGTCMLGNIECQVGFLYEDVTEPPAQIESVVCGDCTTSTTQTGSMVQTGYMKAGQQVILVPPNANNPPEGCARARSSSTTITATISLTAMMVLLSYIY